MDVIDRNLDRVRVVLESKRLIPRTIGPRGPEKTFVRSPQQSAEKTASDSFSMWRWVSRILGRI